ncbi:MAG TPA: DUF3106 domain-containing protein [Lysobacter sp.]|nr:DUF3106 domain-containing protein [Lysobacter sp.]
MTTASPSAAVAAFLRGVERRAALLAELQCGDAPTGDAALGAAMRAFAHGAGAAPMAEWPRRFWGLLLAAPQLRRAASASAWPPLWRPLAGLGHGTRAALLLRLVAGLDVDEAAIVLGVSPDACRGAITHALPRIAQAPSAAETWAGWEGAVLHALKALPATRLAQLARLREHALGTGAAAAGRAPAASKPLAPGRWRPRRPVLAVAVAALCALAIAATFLRPHWFAWRNGFDARVATEALPAAEAPAARFDADLAAWSHRDFDLLADPAGVRAAQRLPLLAWYAAQRATRAAADAATPALQAPVPDAATPLPQPLEVAPVAVALPPTPAADTPLPAAVEAAIARLPAPLQPALRADARRWQSWTPAQQAAYRQRQAQWDALPPAVRGEQRAGYAAWRALDAPSRRAIADAARAYDALPPEQREGQRSNFAAQDVAMQRGWLLGPTLGADYAKLQPLLAQLPEAQHADTLRVLRALTPAERIDLAMLAQRTPPQARAELLRGLLSTSDANRAAWLQARVAE